TCALPISENFYFLHARLPRATGRPARAAPERSLSMPRPVRRSGRARKSNGHGSRLVALESRRMLATHVFAGTAGDDTIHVAYNAGTVTVTVNGVNQSMSEQLVDAFVLDAQGGNDTI